MRILLLNQFFYPDIAASAQLATDLAVDLVGAGHEVSAVSGRGVYAGGAKSLPMRDAYRGVKIVRLPCTDFGRGSLAGRLIDYASFLVSSVAAIPFLGRFDVVVVMSTPPLLVVSGLVARRLTCNRLIFWVQDVYPEVALALGAIRQGPLCSILAWVSRKALQGADRVVTIGEVMTERLVAAGADPGKIDVVENWADGSGLVRIPEGEGRLRGEMGLNGRFVVLYSGNLGNAHDFSGLEMAIEQITQIRRDVVFVFAGEGAQKARLMKRFSGREDFVRFLPYREREDLAEGLALGDLHVVTQRRGLEGLVVPSKFYGILAAGRPVLYLGPERTEVARRVQQLDVGETVEPEDAEAIEKAVSRWAEMSPSKRQEVGIRARSVFDSDFDRKISTGRWGRILTSLIPNSRVPE